MTQGPDDTPLVSLALTTYERPELAKRAVESMVTQTYENTEVIVVEDAGEATIREWVRANHDEVNFIRHEQNRGLAAARNTAIDAATGKYVAFLDDDDEWLPEKTERQVGKAEELLPGRDLGVVYCGVEDHFEHESRTAVRHPKNDGLLREEIIEKGARTLSSSYLFLQDALLDVDGFDESLPSSIDHDIWMSLAAAGYEAGTIREPLVVKRHSDEREEMTSDPETRIGGVRKYTEKWRPVYQEWLGETEGAAYADEYFADVVGRLAAKKAFNLELRDAATATAAVVGYNPWRPSCLYYLLRHGVIVGGSRVLPRSLKDVLNEFI